MSQRSSERPGTLRRAGKLLAIAAAAVAAAVVQNPLTPPAALAAGDGAIPGLAGAQLGDATQIAADHSVLLPSAPAGNAQRLQFGPPAGFRPPIPPNMGRPDGIPSNEPPPPPVKKKKPVRKLPPKPPAKKQPEQPYVYRVVRKADEPIDCLSVQDDGAEYILGKRGGLTIRVLKSDVDHIEDVVTGATTRPTSRPTSRPVAKGKPAVPARPSASPPRPPAK